MSENRGVLPDDSKSDVISDEPERVRLLSTGIFAAQSSAYTPTEDAHSSLRVSLGADAADDAAVFDFTGSGQLVASSDYVRGTGFTMYELGLLSSYDIGYYLVAANVSDIAAMGARQLAFLSVVRYPSDLSDNEFLAIFHGIRDACSEFRTVNVGGDIGSEDRVILSGTALGVCAPGKAVSRSGARIGDKVVLSRPTGLAGAARDLFRVTCGEHGELQSAEADTLVHAWSRPRPEVELGRFIGDNGLATSCQDTSDGLKATLEQLASASGVAFRIEESLIPIDPVVEKVARYLGRETMDLVLSDSVDFGLVFTVAQDEVLMLDQLDRELYFIGDVVSGAGVTLSASNGLDKPLPGNAWKHLD